jgi:hypothetical protein
LQRSPLFSCWTRSLQRLQATPSVLRDVSKAVPFRSRLLARSSLRPRSSDLIIHRPLARLGHQLVLNGGLVGLIGRCLRPNQRRAHRPRSLTELNGGSASQWLPGNHFPSPGHTYASQDSNARSPCPSASILYLYFLKVHPFPSMPRQNASNQFTNEHRAPLPRNSTSSTPPRISVGSAATFWQEPNHRWIDPPQAGQLCTQVRIIKTVQPGTWVTDLSGDMGNTRPA